ncbi:GNAT family N-acetyltransferase [Roseateles chitinivorans]|uniref:GNAT family N-acetyltransferase n=1 Tax=Roseateles chitinivorans TaxID=2917965 RepID=UPI003D6685F1
MVLPTLDAFDDAGGLVPLTPAAYAGLIGALRGSSKEEIDGHARRLEQASVPHQAFKMAQDGVLLACGQMAIDPGPAGTPDGGIAGLFDIFTPEQQRGRGHGFRLCAALLAEARRQGALNAYLQVGADNVSAQRLYARLGFLQAYRYHYRSDDPRAWA